MVRKAQRLASPPRKRGHGYPVKPAWQEDVRAEIKKRGMTEKDLAKLVGCAQSTMNDTLNKPNANNSSLVPKIHEALGWAPPPDPQSPVPLPSADALEMGHLFDRLPESIRRQMRDQAEAILALVETKPDN